MITRAHIRRQLRASGGITNAVPRQGYFLGKIVKGIGKGLKKVAGIAKQVIKSPIGKAALIGLGGAGLMGLGGPFAGLSGLGARIGGGLGALKTGLLGGATLPPSMGFKSVGLLGKLGLTKGGGSMALSGLGKMLGAGGLIGYFTSKGASEEKAKELAQDVYRGKGIGFDQIRADLNKYRSGELSQSQMFDKNYRFLTPRNFVAAEGGRAGFADGTNYYKDVLRKKGYKDSYFKGMNDKDIRKLYDSVMGTFSLRRAEGGEVGSSAMNKENVKQKFVSDEAGAIPKKGGGVLPSDIGKLRRSDFNTDEDYQRYLRQLNRKAMGGRIGYFAGAVVDPEGYNLTRREMGILANADPSKRKMIRKFLTSRKKHKFVYPDRILENKRGRRTGKAFGGDMMNMPMGNMRRNRAGVMERDYRDERGFVPVGVKEKADDVPAMLSKNEFVMTADAVRGAGDGNIKKGAQRMYDLMKRNEGKVV